MWHTSNFTCRFTDITKSKRVINQTAAASELLRAVPDLCWRDWCAFAYDSRSPRSLRCCWRDCCECCDGGYAGAYGLWWRGPLCSCRGCGCGCASLKPTERIERDSLPPPPAPPAGGCRSADRRSFGFGSVRICICCGGGTARRFGSLGPEP